jgi:hypothetical protein
VPVPIGTWNHYGPFALCLTCARARAREAALWARAQVEAGNAEERVP